jgi:hypothetical protein
VDFKKQRLAGYRLGSHHPRVEPLEVSDLQDASPALGQSRDLLSLLQGARDGLLEKNIHAMGKGLARYFRVTGRGNNHAYGTNRTPHLLQAGEGPDSKFGRQLPGSFGAKVIDSYELRSRDLLQRSRVFLSVLTNPEHGYCNSLAQLHPRLEIRKPKIEIRKPNTKFK